MTEEPTKILKKMMEKWRKETAEWAARIEEERRRGARSTR